MRAQFSKRINKNEAGVIIADAVYTTTQVSPVQDNPNGTALILSLNIKTAPATTETLGLWFQLVDPVTGSGNNGTLVKFTTPAGSGISPNTIYRLAIYPSAGGTPTGMDAQITLVNGIVPKKWLCSVVPSGASNWEYSLGFQTM